MLAPQNRAGNAAGAVYTVRSSSDPRGRVRDDGADSPVRGDGATRNDPPDPAPVWACPVEAVPSTARTVWTARAWPMPVCATLAVKAESEPVEDMQCIIRRIG